ncbi:MAG TPA: CARDB domain-containing protein, partial [Pirellulales bacterium]|nr:CARDB domain-containing protein [Pirellulales bacterium]
MTGFTRGGQGSRGWSSFSRWLARQAATPRSKKRRGKRHPLAARTSLFQILEPRTVLSAVSWVGPATGGNWDVAANWTGGAVPGSGDNVTIDTGATAATITIQSGDSESVGSLTTTANDTLSITGGSLTVNAGTSALSGPLDMTGGSLEATGTGASLTANGATTVSNASLYAENGGSLSFPKLTSTISNGTFEANGTRSLLDVSALTTVTQQAGWTVNATGGGEVNLSGLASLTSTQGITIHDTGGSTILDANLTSLSGVIGTALINVTLDGTDQHVADSWTTFTGGYLEVDGNPSDLGYNLPKLSDVDQSGVHVEGGGQLTLPNLTSFVSNDSALASNGAFEANGTNTATGQPSVLDVSALTKVTQQGYWSVNAINGGEVNLSKLASLTSTQGITITDTGGSTLLDGNLTSLSGVIGTALINATLDGTDQHVADSWTKFTGGYLEVDGNPSDLGYNLSKLTDVDQSGVHVEGGGQLTLPNLASFVSNDSALAFSGAFEANGTNTETGQPSVLDVSALTKVTQQGFWSVNAINGGEVKLSGLASLTSTQGIAITDTGGSTLLDSKLATLSGVGITLDGTDPHVVDAWTIFTGGTLTVTSGSLTFPKLTDFASSSPVGGTALDFPVLTTGSLTLADGTSATIQGTLVALPASGAIGATVNAPASRGLGITLDSSRTFSGGTTVNVGAGTTLALAGGTYLGGATFNVAQGAAADLTGGQTTTYGGTLTATGAGTVVISGGIFYPAKGGGATLNFTGGMFQWTGGAMELSVGDVTNRGTINLSGANETQIFADGTLDNYGSIIQTGSGDFGLHSDNVTPTTLKIEPGAQYLMESDAGIDNQGLGDNVIDNLGTIKKTAGSETSTLYIPSPGYLSNTGTIEADSGTLDLEPNSFAQIDGKGNLTGGTWKALNGAILDFPSGTSITTNAATIALDGSGATMTALTGLAANSGSLTLTGASLSTPGDFTNSGSLTVFGGLGVGGNFTQTAAGTLDEQIGGAPASGLFGQIAATGTATLAGNFNVSLVNSFTPVDGQDYPVLTYASATGSFAATTGLPSGMTANQTATEFDLDMPAAATPTADLAVAAVTAPTTASDGQSITVNWQVQDLGTTAAAGNWTDSVYLSTTPAITSNSALLGSVEHTGGLAANGSYSGSLTEALGALPPGNYYVLVEADSHDQVPDADRGNNTLAATTGQLAVSVPGLTLGTPATGAFTAADQDQYYQVTVPAGGSLVVALTSSATSGGTALYVSQGTEPTPYGYQFAAVADQPNQTLSVPNAAGGTYYILVHSVSGAAATAGYTLTTSQTSALGVSAISSYSGGNAGNATIEIDGANFTTATTASLSLGGATINASAVDFVSASQLFATFNLAGATAGSYALKVQQGVQSATAPTPFQVVAASPASLNVVLITPQLVRSGRTGTIVVTYTNETANDLVAPLLTVASTNPKVLFSTPDDPNNYVASAEILAVAPSGPAGILRPGQSGQLTLTLLSEDTVNGDSLPVEVSQIETGQTIDWASQQAALRPPSISAAGWNVVYGNLTAALGTTSDAYNAALAQAASYLSGLGDTTSEVSDVSRLWSFLVAQANASFPTPTLTSAVDASLPTPGGLSLAIDRTFVSSIAGRYQQGMFGMGWSTSWQSSLSVDGAGNVTIDSGGAVSFFVAQPNGDYLDTAGEAGTLTSSGGVFTFTATFGTQYVFLAGGLLNYVQDTNGNRITLGYNSGNQLATLTYSNPADTSQPSEQLTLSYNTQGFVSQVADGTGNVWTYLYDTSAHLLSVTAPGNLTTSYSYDTGSNAQTANALLSIA